MTHPSIVAIQHGWKVFALADEIGQIVDVGPSHIDIQRGLLTKHRYRVPQTHIIEAADGVVDLDIDRESVEAFEVGRSDDGDTEAVVPDALPDQYRRLEYGDDGPVDPTNPPDIHGTPR
jgi:hypothetical protein